MPKSIHQPIISVIVPVYNTEKYLNQCLDSIISQTLREIEIICVDDGSTDLSLNILKEYAEKDSRVKILQQKNKGGGAARNFGMTIATGKYLSFLDSDDFYDADMLSLAYECSEKNDSDITIFECKTYNEQSKRFSKSKFGLNYCYLPKNIQFSHNNTPNHIFDITNPGPCNKLYKHEFIDKNKLNFMEIKKCNDVYFGFISLYSSKRISIINKCLAYYRIGMKTNTQATTYKSPCDIYFALLEVKKKLSSLNVSQDVEKGYINSALEHLIQQLNNLTKSYPLQCKELLSLLVDEGFNNLGISNRSKDYFDNKSVYSQYQQYITEYKDGINKHKSPSILIRCMYYCKNLPNNIVMLIKSKGLIFAIKHYLLSTYDLIIY